MIETLNKKIKVFIAEHERTYNSYHHLNELNKSFEREIDLLQRMGFFKALFCTDAYKESLFGIQMEYNDQQLDSYPFDKEDLQLLFHEGIVIHPNTGIQLSKQLIKQNVYFVLTIPKKTEVKLKFSK